MKLNENPLKGSEDMERTRDSMVYPLTCGFDIESRCWLMCSAHRLIRGKYECHENRSKGSRDMERTLNSRVNHLTLTCDLESR